MSEAWNEQENQDYKAAFDAFDLDGNGTITIQELRTVMISMGQDPTQEELFEMIKEVDDDGNEEIDFDEFQKVMARNNKQEKDTDQDLKRGFEIFDADHDDQISMEDLRQLMQSLGENLSDQDLQDMIRVASLNSNSAVTFDEFKSVLQTK
eukprot:Macronucleus_6570.p1 GENE.Macronucleus_6570~~Macronucleus_6570.p1  ORF type:complete len:151 (+),score=30.12 Macronucleus_6570:1-453(+)